MREFLSGAAVVLSVVLLLQRVRVIVWIRGATAGLRTGAGYLLLACKVKVGSGTTLAAAELTERVCYGLELDPKYVDVVVQRWQALAGKKATLDGDGRPFDEVAAERRKEAA